MLYQAACYRHYIDIVSIAYPRFFYPLCNLGAIFLRSFFPQNSDPENFMLIEMLDANEDGEVDSFEWTTMLSQVALLHTWVPLKGSAHLLSNTTLVSDLAQWLNCLTRKLVLSTFMIINISLVLDF